nr:PREDICTED: mucin-5AC-like isoform X1 [Bemisia tabaci]
MRLCEISAVLLLLLSSRAIHVTAQSQRRGARRFQTPNAELVSDEERTFESRQSRDSASLNWSPRRGDSQESAEPLDSSRGFNQLDRRKGSSHFDLESNLSYDALKTSQQKSTLTTNSDRYKNERPPALPRKRVETTDSLPSPTPRQESKYPRRGKLFSPETFSTRQPETSPTSESSFQSRQRSPASNSEQTDGSSSRRGRQRSRGESAKSLFKDLNANVEEDKDTSIQESDNYPGVYKQLKNQGISTFEIQEKLKLEAAKKSKNDGRQFNSVITSNLPSRNRETEINRNILPDPKAIQRPSQLDFGKTRAGQTSTQSAEADHVTQKVSTFRGSVYGRFRPEGSFKSTTPSPEIPRDFATEEPIDARNNLQRSKQAFQPRRPITTRPREQFSPRPRQSSGLDATHQSTTERTTVNAVESYRISARQKAQRTEDSTAETNQKTTGGDTRSTFKSHRVPLVDVQKEIPGARIDREKYFRKPTRNFSRLGGDKENVSPTKDESEVPNPGDSRPPFERETSIEPKKERETQSKKYKAPYRGGRLGQIPEPKEESAQTQAPPPILGMRGPIRTLSDGELVPLEEYYDSRSSEGRKNGGDPAGRRLPSRYPPKRSFAEMVASLNAELGNRTTTVKAPFKPKTSSRPPGEEDQENVVDDDPLDFSSPDGFSLSGSELKEVSLESASLKGDSSNNSESSNIQFIDSKPITNITSSTKDEASNNGTNPSPDTLPLANDVEFSSSPLTTTSKLTTTTPKSPPKTTPKPSAKSTPKPAPKAPAKTTAPPKATQKSTKKLVTTTRKPATTKPTTTKKPAITTKPQTTTTTAFPTSLKPTTVKVINIDDLFGRDNSQANIIQRDTQSVEGVNTLNETTTERIESIVAVPITTLMTENPTTTTTTTTRTTTTTETPTSTTITTPTTTTEKPMTSTEKASMKAEVPFFIYGLYPNGTVVRRFPNGTVVPEEDASDHVEQLAKQGDARDMALFDEIISRVANKKSLPLQSANLQTQAPSTEISSTTTSSPATSAQTTEGIVITPLTTEFSSVTTETTTVSTTVPTTLSTTMKSPASTTAATPKQSPSTPSKATTVKVTTKAPPKATTTTKKPTPKPQTKPTTKPPAKTTPKSTPPTTLKSTTTAAPTTTTTSAPTTTTTSAPTTTTTSAPTTTTTSAPTTTTSAPTTTTTSTTITTTTTSTTITTTTRPPAPSTTKKAPEMTAKTTPKSASIIATTTQTTTTNANKPMAASMTSKTSAVMSSTTKKPQTTTVKSTPAAKVAPVKMAVPPTTPKASEKTTAKPLPVPSTPTMTVKMVTTSTLAPATTEQSNEQTNGTVSAKTREEDLAELMSIMPVQNSVSDQSVEETSIKTSSLSAENMSVVESMVKLGEKSQLVMDMIEAAKLTGEFETDPNVLANKIIELAIERAKNMQKNSNDNQKLVESNRIGKSLENSMKTEGMATEEFKSEVDNSTLNMLLNNEDRAKLSQAEILNAILSSPDILGPNANQITSYEKKTTKKPKKKKPTTTTAAPLRLLGLLGNLRNPPRQTSSSDFGDFDENDQPDATSDFGMDDTYGRPMNEGLLGAVLEVTRAMSRLMATVVQGATRSLRNFLRQRTRSLTDFLASGSAG